MEERPTFLDERGVPFFVKGGGILLLRSDGGSHVSEGKGDASFLRERGASHLRRRGGVLLCVRGKAGSQKWDPPWRGLCASERRPNP